MGFTQRDFAPRGRAGFRHGWIRVLTVTRKGLSPFSADFVSEQGSLPGGRTPTSSSRIHAIGSDAPNPAKLSLARPRSRTH